MNLFNPLGKRITNKQIITGIMYVAFFAVGVWAIGESLSRTINFPKFVCYLMGLFTLGGASFFISLVHESMGSGYVSKRMVLMVVGIGGFIPLWCASFMSNTHNIYFVSTVDQMRQRELRDVKNQLELVKGKSMTSVQSAKEEFSRDIEQDITAMQSEILNVGDPGHGPKTDSIIRRLESKLGANVQRLVPLSTSPTDLRNHAEQMGEEVRAMRKNKLNSIDSSIAGLQSLLNEPAYQSTLNNLDTTIKQYSQKSVGQVKETLLNSFSYYNKCYDYISQLFTIPSLQKGAKLDFKKLPETPPSFEIESIAKAWHHFRIGDYERANFYLAILWAFILDLACFGLFYFGVLPPEDTH